MKLILSIILISLGYSQSLKKVIPLKDGEYKFIHKFAEHPQMTGSITLDVIIKGDKIKIINNDRDDVFEFGIIDQGTIVWHAKTGNWIVSHKPSDKELEEVGYCTDGPSIIDFEKLIYWTC